MTPLDTLALGAVADHLRTPLHEGGHGLRYVLVSEATEAGLQRAHEADHDPGAWWHDAIQHQHEASP
jgi:hypothetical protein